MLEMPMKRDWALGNQQPVLARLLGLTPVVAMSSTLLQGVVAGVVLMLVLTLACVLSSALRWWCPARLRGAMLALICASLVSLAGMLLQVWDPGLSDALGIYLPLLAASSLLLVPLHEQALRLPVAAAGLEGLLQGVSFTGLMIPFSALREWLAWGTLLRGTALESSLPGLEQWGGLPLLAQPAGALLLLAVVLAGRNQVMQMRQLARVRTAAAQGDDP